MSFFGLMTVKAHEAALAHERYFIACRDETIAARNATIERLQRENARLLSEASGLRIQNDTHVELGRSANRRLQALIAERDAIRTELADLKAERDRRMAPLIAANAARAAKARERAGSVG